MPRRVRQESPESESEEEPAPRVVPKKRGRPSKNCQDASEDDSEASPRKKRGGGKAAKLSGQEIRQKARDLVRLAIANEVTRRPLKREEISKTVLGQTGRASFNPVMKMAQDMLKKTFGYELVELRGKNAGMADRIHDVGAAKQAGKGKKATAEAEDDSSSGEEVNSIAHVAASGKKKAGAGPKQYILRSALPAKYIKRASMVPIEGDDQLVAGTTPKEGEGLQRAVDLSKDETDDWRKDDGALFDWKRGDQQPLMGVLQVILALILISERRCSDDKLRIQLKKLGLRSAYEMPHNPSFAPAQTKQRTFDSFLETLIKQGYLEKTVNKRMQGMGGNDNANGDAAVDWTWGPRADAEIGEKASLAFMLEFIDFQGTAKEIEESKIKRSAEIEESAGGKLQGVTLVDKKDTKDKK